MSKTARDIIIKAFYLLGSFSPQDKPAEHQIIEGLDCLNDLLSEFSANELMVPYRKKMNFETVANKGQYLFANHDSADVISPKVTELLSVNISLNNAAYPVTIISPDVYSANYRFENATRMPRYAFLQNAPDSSLLQFFPAPDKAYQMELIGKFVLSSVLIDTPLTELPDYYSAFLRYALARDLNDLYRENAWDAAKQKRLDDLTAIVENSNDTDLTIKLDNTAGLSGSTRLLYGD